MGADLVMFTELFLAGYPAEDLVLKPAFQDVCREACEAARPRDRRWRARHADRAALARGRRSLQRLCAPRRRPHHACASRSICRITASSTRSASSPPGRCRDRSISAAFGSAFRSARISGPATWSRCLAETGAEMLLVPNGSPYWRGKTDERFNIAAARVTETGLPLVYLNEVGGQDELVFDGASFVLNADRSLGAQLPAFRGPSRSPTGREARAAGRCVEGAAGGWSRRATRRIMPPASWGCATMSKRTAFPASCSACRAASIPRICAAMAVDALGAGARALRDAALSLHRRTNPFRMRRTAPRRSASATTSCRSRRRSRVRARRSSRSSPDKPRDITEETSRAARAARS